MKKLFGSAFILIFLAACEGTGDRQHNMETNVTEAPTEGINNTEAVKDSSAMGIGDSTTTMAHDTGAVRKN